VFFLLAACPSNESIDEPIILSPALAFFRDNNLQAGWNIGNSLDSPKSAVPPRDGETGWGNPLINQAIMNGVKKAGFGLVRIPVTWTGFIGPSPDYKIDPARLARIAQVVDFANNAGLAAIINLHHDGASNINNTTGVLSDSGWISLRRAYTNETDRAAITNQIKCVWEQIAEYFRDYNEKLLFESFNEIHDGGWGWSNAFKNPALAKAQFDVLNDWNQIFVDLVRQSGGNNSRRFLVIPSYVTNPECTYPGGRIPDHPVNNVGDNFRLPIDTVPGRLIVTFHYYRPESVGINGTKHNWGLESERQIIDRDFAPFNAYFVSRGIPVIIGECGAVRQLHPGDPAREGMARDSRLHYLYEVFTTAKKYGLVPVYWDNGSYTGTGEKFGLFNRNTGEPNSLESKLLIDTMIEAVRY
jgi:endoglucanase